jgi:tRNA(Ile)-lysidine synthase
VSVTDGWPLDQGKDADLLMMARHAFPPDGFRKVGVAVSGGGDSIALLHLMQRVAPHEGWDVLAVTVDHDLRDASANEAAGVAEYCASLGVPHTTLRWDHGAIAGNVMDAARRARMRLVGDWARAQGIAHVALGHTADDQAETFLMGLARASGLDGLAGMRGFWREDGVNWARPLLWQSRAALRDYLRRHGIGWVDDPTNDDDSYTRIKARKALATLAPLGITVESLTATVGHLTLARHALRKTVVDASAQHVTEMVGALHINRAGFASLADDVQRRLILAAISWLSGDPYPPRSAKQETLRRALQHGRAATVHGCRFRVGPKTICILREPKAVATLEAPTTSEWDNRWHLDGPHAPGLTIRALGDGIRACPDWRATGIPRDALVVSPAIWRGDVLIAAPLAGFGGGWTATLRPDFVSFLLSH